MPRGAGKPTGSAESAPTRRPTRSSSRKGGDDDDDNDKKKNVRKEEEKEATPPTRTPSRRNAKKETPSKQDALDEDEKPKKDVKPKKSAAKKAGKKTAAPKAKRQKIAEPSDESSDSEINGMDAIVMTLQELYGDRGAAAHYGTIIPWSLGGPDPLRAVGCFYVPPGKNASTHPAHWHYVTYGFSDLFQKENPDPEVSGFGFELTLRLKLSAEDAKIVGEADKKIKHKTSNYLLEYVPKWPINMLNNLARYVFNTHRTFDVGDHMNLNGPICFSSETQIRAALFAPDSALPASIRTPFGAVKFIQFVGITEDEYELTWEWSSSGLLDFIRSESPMLVTDLERESLLNDNRTLTAIRKKVEADGSHLGMLFSGVIAKWSKLTPNGGDESSDDNGDAAGAVGAGGGAARRKNPVATAPKKKTGFLTSRQTKSSAMADILKAPRSMPTQGYKIKLGAMIVRQLIRVLRGRLPYGRPLSILGPHDELITFIPADGMEDERDDPKADIPENDDKDDAEPEKPKKKGNAKSRKRKRQDSDDEQEEDDEKPDEKTALVSSSSKRGKKLRVQKGGKKKDDDEKKETGAAAPEKKEERINVIEISEEVDKRGHGYLSVTLSNDIVRDICSMLKPTKGTYIFGEGANTLMFVVKPTDIKSALGDEVVETIGDD